MNEIQKKCSKKLQKPHSQGRLNREMNIIMSVSRADSIKNSNTICEDTAIHQVDQASTFFWIPFKIRNIFGETQKKFQTIENSIKCDADNRLKNELLKTSANSVRV